MIGGSLAGLLAARVLADCFATVTIIERDRQPDVPDFRPGVPQARHVHVLLLRGLRALEELFPGIRAEWTRRGADLIDTARDFEWLTPRGWAPRFDSGLPFLAASRPLIEWAVAQRVSRLPNVTRLENAEATNLRFEERTGAVTGVYLRARNGANIPAMVDADLVVDASGRSSVVPDWLAAKGFGRPAETIVDGHLGYASRIYRRRPESQAAWRASYSQAAPPAVCRTGLAFPIEDDRWIVTLAGGGGDYPPTDENGFVEFARSLPNPGIYQVMAESEPLSAICAFRATQNRIRHYEKLRMPPGLAVLGDAACAFNPVYGQGISTAAIAANLLRECLRQDRLSEFQRKLASALEPAWLFATSEDVRYPGAQGATMTARIRLMHRYIDAVLALSVRKPAVRASLLEVLHMVRPPSLLFRPSILLPVLAEGKIWRAHAQSPPFPKMRTSDLGPARASQG